MSSKDDPFGLGGRTVIRPGAGRDPNATVIAPASAAPPFAPSTGTIIAPRLPDPPTDRAGHTVIQPGGLSAAVDELPEGAGFHAANPLLSAAAPLLTALGRLRLVPGQIPTTALADQLSRLIAAFDAAAIAAGVPEAEVRIARYALCETADDIVENLPGRQRETWRPHSMLMRFFETPPAGTGFFNALNQVLAEPAPHLDVIELMHACLSLGYQGRYRGQPQGAAQLERIRRDVYATLRADRPRPAADISPRWQGLTAVTGGGGRRVPLWAIAAGLVAVVAGSFFLVRSLATDEADAMAEAVLALDPVTQVTIERADFAPMTEEEAPRASTQLERIAAALASEIDAGGVSVEARGDFIVVEIDNALLFESGKAELKPEFAPVAARLAEALGPEPGTIRIVGHTDNVKPRRSGPFKSNYDLSVARAKAVEAALAGGVGDAARLTVEGKGEDEPIADNATPEGRAKNRRVDLLLPREETL